MPILNTDEEKKKKGFKDLLEEQSGLPEKLPESTVTQSPSGLFSTSPGGVRPNRTPIVEPIPATQPVKTGLIPNFYSDNYKPTGRMESTLRKALESQYRPLPTAEEAKAREVAASKGFGRTPLSNEEERKRLGWGGMYNWGQEGYKEPEDPEVSSLRQLLELRKTDPTSQYTKDLTEKYLSKIAEKTQPQRPDEGISIIEGGILKAGPGYSEEEEAREYARRATKTVGVYNSSGQKIGEQEVPDYEARSKALHDPSYGQKEQELTLKEMIAQNKLIPYGYGQMINPITGKIHKVPVEPKQPVGGADKKYTAWEGVIDKRTKQIASKYRLSDVDMQALESGKVTLGDIFGNKGLSKEAATNYLREMTNLENTRQKGYQTIDSGGSPWKLLGEKEEKSTRPRPVF